MLQGKIPHDTVMVSCAATKTQCRQINKCIGLKEKKGVRNISHKESEVLPFSTMCMDLQCILLNENSQTEKDIYSLYYHSYVETKKLNKCI